MGNSTALLLAPASGTDPRLLKSLDGNAVLVSQQAAGSRMFKTCTARLGHGGIVIVKFFRRLEGVDLSAHRDALAMQRQVLAQCPNVVPYSRIVEIESFVLLVRQHFAFNLTERFSTRPFLSSIEKRWIAYLLVKALCQMHAHKQVHGDIKSDNVLLTTWGWVVLADPAPFKPALLPSSQPQLFNFFFSATRKRCYLAPERIQSFSATPAEQPPPLKQALTDPEVGARVAARALAVAANVEPDEDDEVAAAFASAMQDNGLAAALAGGGMPADKDEVWASVKRSEHALAPSMDIFSLGVVLCELFLDGELGFGHAELLTLAQTGQSAALEHVIGKLPRGDLMRVVRSMTARDPAHRLRAQDYLDVCLGDLFPLCFETFLYPFMRSMITDDLRDSDSRIWLVVDNYGKIAHGLTGAPDVQGEALFAALAAKSPVAFKRAAASSSSASAAAASAATTAARPNQLAELVALIDALSRGEMPAAPSSSSSAQVPAKQTSRVLSHSPDSAAAATAPSEAGDSPLVIVVGLVSSCLQSARKPSSRRVALLLLERLAALADDDEVRLQRVTPFVVSSLADASPAVRRTSLYVLARVVDAIATFPPSDARVFAEYVLPAVYERARDESEMVRVALAEVLPTLANASKRFLELSQLLRVQQSAFRREPMVDGSYDADQRALHDSVEKIMARLADTNDGELTVKRALVSQVYPLCVFFGRERTDEFVLPWLISVANARSPALWPLRVALLQSIAAVGAFVGTGAVEQFLLPLVQDLLQDAEDLVVEAALRCVGSMVKLSLLRRQLVLQVCKSVLPVAFHPAQRLRGAVVRVLATCACALGYLDTQVELVPLLASSLEENSPFTILLGRSGVETEEAAVLERVLAEPLTREEFEHAVKQCRTVGHQIARDARLVQLRPLLLAKASTKVAAASATGSSVAPPSSSTSSSLQRLGPAAKPHTVLVSSARPPVPELDTLSRVMARYGLVTPLPQDAMQHPTRLASRLDALEVPALVIDLGAPAPSASADLTTMAADWRPRGVLVASLHGHSAAVNRVVASEDSILTASDDGAVKAWSTARIDQVACPAPRATFTLGARVVDLCVIKPTASVAAGTADGKVHLIRVERGESSSVVSRFELAGGALVGMAAADRVLLAATVNGEVHCLDPRAGTEAWTLALPRCTGLVRTLAVSADAQWVVLGSARGVLVLVDLRHRLAVAAWRQPSGRPVHRLHCSPSTEGRPLAFAAVGGNQLALVNLETGMQRYGFVALNSDPSPDDLVPLAAPYQAVALDSGYPTDDVGAVEAVDPCVRAMLCPCDVDQGSRGIGSPPTVVTAGSDATIRLWDVNEARRGSYVISGPAEASPSRWSTRDVVQKDKGGSGLLFLCRPSNSGAAAAMRKRMSFAPASPAHGDAVLDIQACSIVPIEGGHATHCLVSAGRDCVVKVWR